MRRLCLVSVVAGVFISCGSSARVPSGNAERKSEDTHSRTPTLPGKVISREPLWISVETGMEGRIHVDATDEQLRKLQARYAAVLLQPPDWSRAQSDPPRWDLAGPGLKRPTAFSVTGMAGMPLEDRDLYPISLGVTKDGKEEEIGAASPFRRPLWRSSWRILAKCASRVIPTSPEAEWPWRWQGRRESA